MRRTLQLLSIAVALAMATQAFAAARGDLLVCRFTGAVMDGCPCPAGGEEEPPRLSESSCCELRAAPRVPPSRTEDSRQQLRTQVVLALAPASGAPAADLRAGGPDERISPETPPPPRGRRFIELRQLLI